MYNSNYQSARGQFSPFCKLNRPHPWSRFADTPTPECGWGAGRARRTYLGARYARLGRRRGKKKAALAVGHSILVAAYHIQRDGVPHQDLGPDHFDRVATHRLTRHDVGRLERLGYHVTLDPEAHVAS
jgi:transposase